MEKGKSKVTTLFPCNKCGEVFLDSLSLKSHRLLHSGRKLHSCEFCGKLFRSPAHVLRHYNVHMKTDNQSQNEDNTALLKITMKEEGSLTPISSYARVDHSDIVKVDLFTCETCGEAFTSTKDLQVHQTIHPAKKVHCCKCCGKAFLKQFKLREHERIHTGEKPYKCDTCGSTFTSSSNLKTHQIVHTEARPNVCNNCGKTYKSKTALKRHQLQEALKEKNLTLVKKEEETDLTCGTCGEQFTDAKKLRTHGRIHRKPNICKYCGKNFLKPSHMIRHERVHTGEKPFRCEECGKCFHLSYLLNTHKNSHSGERPYICDLCGKGFGSPQTRSNHRRYVHAEPEQLCMCPDCGKTYRSESGLRTHMLQHTAQLVTSEINEEDDIEDQSTPVQISKIFTCVQCGETFPMLLKLRLHLRLHSGRKVHSCKDCPRVFLSPSFLKQHERTHMGQRHTCEHCGKVFKNIFVFKDHMNLHTKEVLRPCETCDKVFWTRNSYKCHVKRYHSSKNSSVQQLQ